MTTMPYYREFYQGQGTAVAGTWLWGAHVTETDYASVRGEAAGDYYNSLHNDLDEYKWGSVFLPKGTYKFSMRHAKNSASGIAQVLFGTVSLGTKDCYAAVSSYNNVWDITFTLKEPTTADLRFRCNGKNAASTDHYVSFSRCFLQKTG